MKEAIGRHWSLNHFAISESKLLWAILEIFFLRNKGSILLLTNLKSKEELQFTHHGHLIFLRHHFRKFFADFSVSAAKNNFIYIYLTYKQITIIRSSEKSWVSCSWFEAFLQKEALQCVVPSTRCLLQPIEGLVQPVHHVGFLWVLKTWRLHNIHFFFDFSVKKSTFHIHLIK